MLRYTTPRSFRPGFHRSFHRGLISLFLAFLIGFGLNLNPAFAGVNDDRFEGNIFALYAGNGSLVPPKSHLQDSLRNHRVAIILFYLAPT